MNSSHGNGKRVALVIGNSSYRGAPLKNAARDAEAVARALGRVGFSSVKLFRDLRRSQFSSVLADFGEEAAGADVAMMFYAGHGMEVDGQTYLLPVDSQLSHVGRLKFETQQLTDVLSAVGGAKSLGLVVLDACRNTAFRSRLEGIEATRSGMEGLAAIQPTGNVLVAYAAKHGTVALDGPGDDHSPFTAALLRFIATPRLDVRILFGKVRDAVLEQTEGAQEPHLYGSLGGREVCLASEPDEDKAPNVFISYAKRDRERVELLGRALQGHGWNIFWDEKLEVGTEWRDEIEQRLKTAHCVVAVWSRNSIRSDWVKYEAARGIEQGILVPVTIDGTPPPRVFDKVQTENLKDWDGRPEDPRIAKVQRGIEQIVARRSEPEDTLALPPGQLLARMDFVRLAIIATCAALIPSLLVTGIIVSRNPAPPLPVIVKEPVMVKKQSASVPPAPQPPPEPVKWDKSATLPPDGDFFLLVGSYHSRDFAEQLAAKLSAQAGQHLNGRRVTMREYKQPSEPVLYRVLIEPPTTRAEVLDICASLKNIGFKGCSPMTRKDVER